MKLAALKETYEVTQSDKKPFSASSMDKQAFHNVQHHKAVMG